jgi:hypothetical protein
MRAVVTALALTVSLAPSAARAQERPGRESWLVPSLHAVGLLTAERVGAMLVWQHAFSLEDTDRDLRFVREAYTSPPLFDPHRRFFEWDGDRWSINLWGHGLMGSELYLRARQCGHGALPSLAFTAAASAFWEYGVEVWNAHPSVNDLLWTPLGGALLGELRLVVWEAAARLPRGVRAVVRVVVDPLGELERVAGSPC